MRVILLAMIPALLGTCSRPKAPDGDIYRIHPEMMRYFGAFQEGSWWHYREKDSGLLEEVSLSGFFLSESHGLRDLTEALEVDLISDQLPPMDLLTRADIHGHSHMSLTVWEPAAPISGITASFDSILGFLDWDENPIALLDSVEVAGRMYHEVLKLSTDFYFESIEFAPDVGIIRRTYQDGRVFELTEFQLN